MADQFYIVVASQVSASDEDLLSSYFFEQGAEGVSEDLEFTQFDDEYSVETIEKKEKELNIYFSEPPEEDLLIKAQMEFPAVQFKIKTEKNQDWMSEWKKGYQEFALCEGVNVVPSWLKPQKPDELNIFIDPGMAFGTGTHATTQIASELVFHQTQVSQKKVIDVGTGTAILAMLCDLLGADQVVATEIEEMAREVAKQNVSLNQCQKVQVIDEQIEQVQDEFDLVIANIIDGVLVKIQDDLKRANKVGGYMILTGILQERESDFFANFKLDGYKILKKVQKEEWLGLLLKKEQA